MGAMSKLTTISVPNNEQSVRIVFANGSSFVLRQRGQGKYRFTAEKSGNVSIQSFYGQGTTESVNLLFTIEKETE